ncbi:MULTISPECIES: HlyC/CorC family transporter [unclassified Lentimonas]|uniref:HlyC/CorC family transporter n=1 Tax=unclassified Lentimonas TaxID=2630993 RepID=UPI00132CB79C|nr:MULTISPECIES: HlyC/CorC family transporter [unclassified Lentimonas]CAA6692814.1 Magnesium and cobalt efflux protein CorC [Lentimonas sp. CC19]CAA6695024.1 Magnesium and cobalt efflux protein CorC [Lentimonas sp. CC10]CAA7069637.1 Magnesium and cobalt efflux protein CorC [Lentimonas sp. CC11]
MIPFLIVLGLIIISAFFSGSETGLTSVSRAKIHSLKMDGNRKAITVSKLREDKERLIGAILLGNNVVNIAASAIATALAVEYFGPTGVAYATGIMTVLVLIFAEVLPKTYAVRHAERVSLTVAPLLVLIVKVLSPVTLVVQSIVNRFLSLVSVAPQEEISGVDVLRGTVQMYHEEGNVLTEDRDMLSGIFDLGETEIEAIMVHRSDMVMVNADDPIEEIIAFVANSSLSRIPVWQESPDHVIGVIHSKDLFKAAENHKGKPEDLDLKQHLREAWFVPETTRLKNQLNAFKENRKHIALAVDEFGSISGLITLEDIIEEILGEIDDEHDTPTLRRVRKCRDGSYDVNGDISIRDLNRELELGLSDDDATTLAGFVMAKIQRIPDEDEILEIDELMFKILKKERNQLERIKVRKTSEQKPATEEPEKTSDEPSENKP